MPTYEYYCTSCGFEFASEPINICPQCDGQVKRRISGGTGLIFKGSGFYITDYKNKKSSPASTSEEPKKKEKKEKKVS